MATDYVEYLKYLQHLTTLTNLVDEVRTKVGKVEIGKAERCKAERGKVKRKRRSCATREIYRDREDTGYYQVTFLKIKDSDPVQFFEHCRMDRERFDLLLSLINSKLKKGSIRKPISPECRLAVTLTYLSQGVSVQFLSSSFKMGTATVRCIILETCDALWEVLQPLYVPEPTATDFDQIEEDFSEIWGLPHCVGGIGGRHIPITKPCNSGALLCNYKKFYSLVMFAACDARYRFKFVDVGRNAGKCDEGLFMKREFSKKILREANLQTPKMLPGTNTMVPYYFIADAGLPLALHIMKPYAGNQISVQQEIFNKRICRGREMTENTFGILAARWQILTKTICMEPDNAKKVVLACVALHNFVLEDDYVRETFYCPPQYADWMDENGVEYLGNWRDDIQPLLPIQSSTIQRRFDGLAAVQLRNFLCDYFGY